MGISKGVVVGQEVLAGEFREATIPHGVEGLTQQELDALGPPADVASMWLELTGKCPLQCEHCYADSGPMGTTGAMELDDWRRTIDEGVEAGIQNVQLIGGEPTFYPDLPEIIQHARLRGMQVEVGTSLWHMTDKLWDVFTQHDVSLAVSWYSDDPSAHDALTGVPGSHAKTAANIEEAMRRQIPLRIGMVQIDEDQGVEVAIRPLLDMGIDPASVRRDRVRGVGRGETESTGPVADELCGNCVYTIGVLPSGDVQPCVFARGEEFTVGSALTVGGLTRALRGERLLRVRAELNEVFATQGRLGGCDPMCDPLSCPPRNN